MVVGDSNSAELWCSDGDNVGDGGASSQVKQGRELAGEEELQLLAGRRLTRVER